MSRTLLARTSDLLVRARIAHALIGAGAMASHGVSRSTIDRDLLAMGDACFDPKLWHELTEQGVQCEILKGDFSDPLAGVVRLTQSGHRPVDVIVGKFRWQREILERADRQKTEGEELPVVRAADLILLKLYAGGPQDAWDIQQLLAQNKPDLEAEIELRLPDLPAESRRFWQRVRTSFV